jgi:N6-L-threonylcarbamoyladenine synthase
MLVLGIETSCDETGVALYDSERGLLAQALHSQVAMHADYGGVVPELASRDHIRRVLPLSRQVMSEAAIAPEAIDAIAFTQGPGLAGALLVGASTACALAFALNIPAIGVHHLEGHLLSPLLSKRPPSFPFVALLVSGGHTQLLHAKALGHYELLGDTLDDAAGEAFDKSAKLMGLGYPGGPAIAKLAEHGHAGRYTLPRPLMHSGSLDFSFSGLKTAVLNQVNKAGPMDETMKANLAAEVQEAITDVLVKKAGMAMQRTGAQQLVIAGGVSANHVLRRKLAAASVGARGKPAFEVFFPELSLCTDNGAMIALVGALHLAQQPVIPPYQYRPMVKPRWPLEALAMRASVSP